MDVIFVFKGHRGLELYSHVSSIRATRVFKSLVTLTNRAAVCQMYLYTDQSMSTSY